MSFAWQLARDRMSIFSQHCATMMEGRSECWPAIRQAHVAIQPPTKKVRKYNFSQKPLPVDQPRGLVFEIAGNASFLFPSGPVAGHSFPPIHPLSCRMLLSVSDTDTNLQSRILFGFAPSSRVRAVVSCPFSIELSLLRTGMEGAVVCGKERATGPPPAFPKPTLCHPLFAARPSFLQNSFRSYSLPLSNSPLLTALICKLVVEQKPQRNYGPRSIFHSAVRHRIPYHYNVHTEYTIIMLLPSYHTYRVRRTSHWIWRRNARLRRNKKNVERRR